MFISMSSSAITSSICRQSNLNPAGETAVIMSSVSSINENLKTPVGNNIGKYHLGSASSKDNSLDVDHKKRVVERWLLNLCQELSAS